MTILQIISTLLVIVLTVPIVRGISMCILQRKFGIGQGPKEKSVEGWVEGLIAAPIALGVLFLSYYYYTDRKFDVQSLIGPFIAATIAYLGIYFLFDKGLRIYFKIDPSSDTPFAPTLVIHAIAGLIAYGFIFGWAGGSWS